MPNFDAVSRGHVCKALAEYEELGADAFLSRYGFGPAREYLLRYDGKSYDSKAVLGAAHGYATGAAAAASEFSGGRNGAAKILRALGFDVVAAAVSEGRGEMPGGLDDHAARARAEKKAQQRPVATCPTCHMQLPATGLCDECA